MTNASPSIAALLQSIDTTQDLKSLILDKEFQALLELLRATDAFSHNIKTSLPDNTSHKAISLLRRLKTAYAMPASQLFLSLRQLADEVATAAASKWHELGTVTAYNPQGEKSISKLLLKYTDDDSALQLVEKLEQEDPHAIYPTSSYRSSKGTVNSNEDGSYIEAVLTQSTMTEINITEGVLDHDNYILRDMYQPLGRCVCVLDSNVSEHYGDEIKAYFKQHDVALELLVYRAMEVDKGIHTVEKLLADFKNVGVSRQEPVLIVGGGVIADVGGLACSLYHRSTPYVMLATSIVSGIDAGPSPRTCCDGFGFKNLFGAYHAPVLTLTDRSFFKTLRTGWIRHGIAEIIKMAVVKDLQLFELLEETGIELVYSGFGTVTDDQKLKDNGQKILSLAMKSYVEAEYGNLYETHQCRPHAYGHTWSPGYEIPSGMLHGHAVACGMGFGAHLSYLQGWISDEERDRVLKLISSFELSLWHPILDKTDLIYNAQVKVTEKRGGNLAAPIPKNGIGTCGYLNELSHTDLENAMASYKELCATYERNGLGVEPLCEDVGLEDPSTVAHSTLRD